MLCFVYMFMLIILCYQLYICLAVFVFFKQKRAYEVRISDWSSDVCSSDLPRYNLHSDSGRRNDRGRIALREPAQTLRDVARNVPIGVFDRMLQGEGRFLLLGRMLVSESGDVPVAERKALGTSQNERVFEDTSSAERRVGKACVSK